MKTLHELWNAYAAESQPNCSTVATQALERAAFLAGVSDTIDCFQVVAEALERGDMSNEDAEEWIEQLREDIKGA